MISYEEAVKIIRAAAAGADPARETIDISAIAGRVSAREVRSPLSVPSFDNAAMDGFALRAAESGQKLKVETRIAAGDVAGDIDIGPGACAEIMTGAPLPRGVDAIVPVEQAQVTQVGVSFSVRARVGDHIRPAGSDFEKDAAVIDAGVLLGAQHVLPLASLGLARLEVYARPTIAFIPTGREITPPGQALAPGRIYNSNSPYALSCLNEAGADVLPQDVVADDPAAFQRLVEKLMDDDIPLILSSGAVSAGAYDFVRRGLEEMGADILFHKAAIKPGKPVLFARLPNGAFYFGLPGNPVSTAVGIRFFVQPFLRGLLRRPPEAPMMARAKTPLSRKPGVRLFLKTSLAVSGEGMLEASFLDGQELYKTAPFLAMNGWAEIPENIQSIDINDLVAVYPLPSFSPPT